MCTSLWQVKHKLVFAWQTFEVIVLYTVEYGLTLVHFTHRAMTAPLQVFRTRCLTLNEGSRAPSRICV